MVPVHGEAKLGRRALDDGRRWRGDGVHQLTTAQAERVVVTVDAAVEAAGVIAERQLQDGPVIGEGVQRVVDRAEGDARQDRPHPLEDVEGARVVVAGPHRVEDRLALWGHPQRRAANRIGRPLLLSRVGILARAHRLASA